MHPTIHRATHPQINESMVIAAVLASFNLYSALFLLGESGVAVFEALRINPLTNASSRPCGGANLPFASRPKGGTRSNDGIL